MASPIHDLEEKAIRIARRAGLKDWHPWLYEAAVGGVVVTGAPCPLITRGRNRGRPNYRKRDMNRVAKVIVR